MRYVVVRPAGELSRIYIVDEGTAIQGPFESWALRDGKQILFATTKMHKVLQNQHFAGSYDKGAMYAYAYEDLCAVMTVNLGPSDRDRYEAGLKEDSQPVLIRGDEGVDHLSGWHRVAYILWKTLILVTQISIKSLNIIIFLVLLPLAMKFVSGLKK